MDAFTRATKELLQIAIKLGGLILASIFAVEIWTRGQLAPLELPPAIKTTLLIAPAATLTLAALKLFGGLIRIAVVLVLLLTIHVLLPVIGHWG